MVTVKIMKKILLFVLLSFSFCFSQKQTLMDKKFAVELHYLGNFRNKNFISDNYNGILGVDFRYKLAHTEIIDFNGGLTLDYFQGRTAANSINNFDFSDMLAINPNGNVVFNIKNTNFKPFASLGFTFLRLKYKPVTRLIQLNSNDPAFSNTPIFTENSTSLTIGAGFIYNFTDTYFFQTSYKYIPEKSNVNVHLINVGFGVNL